MKHSPTPWKIEMYEDEMHGIKDKDGQVIVETDAGYYPPRMDDAKFICVAVNNHEELILALKEAVRVLQYSNAINFLNMAEKVLYKVEGE